MTQPEWLLLNSLAELQRQIATSDEFKNLLAAGTLRRLLLDGDRLLNQANRQHKLKLKFMVCDNTSVTEQTDDFFRFMGRGISPITPSPRNKKPAKELGVDAFLAYQIGMVYTHPFTIADIVDAAANRFGGVHLESPENWEEKERAMRNFSAFFAEAFRFTRLPLRINSLTICTQSLCAIGEVVIAAAEPLVLAIKSHA